MTTTATPPWTLPFEDVGKARILYVYETSTPWARNFAQQYCLLHGIPQGNMVALTFATPPNTATYLWSPGANLTAVRAALFNDFLIPLIVALTNRRANAVILGPGMPIQVLTGTTGASTLTAYPPLAMLVSEIRQVFTVTNGGTTNYLAGISASSENWNWATVPNPTGGAGTTITGQGLDQTVGSVVEAVAFGDFSVRVPTLAQTRTIWRRSGSGRVAVGFVGWPGWSSQSFTPLMQQNAAFKLLDQSRATLAAAAPASVQRSKPVLMFMAPVSANPVISWQTFCNAMIAWGLPNLKYAYSTNTSYASGTPLPASCFATPDQIYNGTPPAGQTWPLPYYLQIGATLNNAIFDPPTGWASVSRPVTGGTSLIQGPSFGYYQNVNDVAGKQGARCLTDTEHLVAGESGYPFTQWWNTLRGMSGLAAAFWYDGSIRAFGLPAGDPLLAPYADTPPPRAYGGPRFGYRWAA